MIGRLERVLVVEPPRVIDRRAFDAAEWLEFDVDGLRTQARDLRRALTDAGAEVIEGAPAPADNPDAIYAYDGLLVTRAGAILMRMIKPNRIGEPGARKRDLDRLGIPVLGTVTSPGHADAGDTLWLAEDRMAIAVGWRTNLDGARQIAALVEPLGITVEVYDLPAYRGPDFCLHLMSLISFVDRDLAVVYRPLTPVRLLRRLEASGVRLLDSSESEFDTLGTNMLALEPGHVLAVAGNPQLIDAVRAAGGRVTELHAPDLCMAGTGGTTCLTRPILRGSLA